MPVEMIGQAVPRTEAVRFVSGRGKYIDDIQRPKQVYARIVRSSVAHGLIRHIDVSVARATPGVLAVLTGHDFQGLLKPIPQRTCPLPGMENFLQRPIAIDRVRYVGEPIALVIAEDAYIAEDAAELVQPSIEDLPVVVRAEQALTDEVLLHPEQASNSATTYQVGFGDCDAAFAQAAAVVEERFYIHRHSAAPLECRGLIAEWDTDQERMSVWGATKVPFANRAILADMLNLAPENVDMIECDVGGSFGVRGDFYPEDYLIPYAARLLDRPVKWVEDRRESLMALNHSRETYCTLALALDATGRILGMRGSMLVDHGAYVRTNTGVMAGKGTQFLPGPYRIPATKFDVRSVCTNKTPAGTYRGPGRYESTFARERLIDLAAQKLQMDPIQLRRINLIQRDEMPYNAGALVPNMPAAVYDSGDYHDVLERALVAFNWNDRISRNGTLVNGRHIGLGIGCFVESTGGGPGEHVRLTLRAGGVFDLALGASSAGQGHETSMAQVLADSLDVPMQAIRVHHGSTTLLDKGFGAYHSRSAVMSGNATLRAGDAMRERLLKVASNRLGRQISTLRWTRGEIVDAETGAMLLTLSELSQGVRENSGPEDRGEIEVQASFMCDQLTYTFGVHLAEVAVDPLTAQVEVLDYFCTEDVGRVINPEIVHGQTIGAAVQGLGGTFLDEFIYDDNGQLVTGTFADYLLPTSTDFPHVRGETLELHRSLHNPLGVKGAGEGGIIATGAAVANAVSAALTAAGVSITSLPVSINKLAEQIRTASYKKSGEPMQIQGKYLLNAHHHRVWQALMDPAILKQAIPGCQGIEAKGPNVYELDVKSSVGPVSLRMRSTMRIENIVEGESYRLVIEGQAGPAGFAKGEVKVRIAEIDGSKTQLDYDAEGEIGGKLAQVGARLVEGVVAKMTAQFFKNFQAQLEPSLVLSQPLAAAAGSIWPSAAMIPWLIAAASFGAALASLVLCGLRGG